MLQKIVNESKTKMEETINHLKNTLKKISTGFASPSMLDGIQVDYYGTITPLNQMASISTPEARQLAVKPFDKTQIETIVNAINSSDTGLNANDSGDIIRINIPPLTEETRQKEAKKVSEASEKAKITIRQIRQDANNKIKNSESTDDDKKGYSQDIQELVNEYNSKIDSMAKDKEKNILEL